MFSNTPTIYFKQFFFLDIKTMHLITENGFFTYTTIIKCGSKFIIFDLEWLVNRTIGVLVEDFFIIFC